MSVTWRKIVIGFATLIGIIVVAFLGIGWYYSSVLRDGALAVDNSPGAYDLTVAAIGNGQITLDVTKDTDLKHGPWRSDGTWGLQWDGGYAQVGKIVSVNDSEVVRQLTPVNGLPPVGQPVRLDSWAYEGDPMTAFSIPFQEVNISSQGAQFPAWYIQGNRDTWVIMVHGWRASRGALLRTVPIVTDMGFPSLTISYHNDKGMALTESGYYDFGSTEWHDLEAAVQYALDHGAAHVVLLGQSMGGAITMSFLYNSDLASQVDAVVLDAPMLDFGDVVNFGAERRGYPGIFTWAGKTMASLRFGIDWAKIDYLTQTDKLKVPILLAHGEDDWLVNIRTSDRLAALRPDIVTYVKVPGAQHVGAWNVDPEAYKTMIEDFLNKTLPAPATADPEAVLAGTAY